MATKSDSSAKAHLFRVGTVWVAASTAGAKAATRSTPVPPMLTAAADAELLAEKFSTPMLCQTALASDTFTALPDAPATGLTRAVSLLLKEPPTKMLI